jgi:hypothetical protein
MSISKVIKDAVTYPILDKKNWMIVGVFLIICNLINVFMNLNRNGLIAIIGLIAITVIIIILFGFNLSVTEYTIKGKTDYPKFNLTKNFMDGIKVVIDRFEGPYAVCEKEDRTMIDIKRIKLPSNAKEGCVLIIEGDKIIMDVGETERRKKHIESLTKNMWN